MSFEPYEEVETTTEPVTLTWPQAVVCIVVVLSILVFALFVVSRV